MSSALDPSDSTLNATADIRSLGDLNIHQVEVPEANPEATPQTSPDEHDRRAYLVRIFHAEALVDHCQWTDRHQIGLYVTLPGPYTIDVVQEDGDLPACQYVHESECRRVGSKLREYLHEIVCELYGNGGDA